MSVTPTNNRHEKPKAEPLSQVPIRESDKATLLELMRRDGLVRYADAVTVLIREAAEKRGIKGE